MGWENGPCHGAPVWQQSLELGELGEPASGVHRRCCNDCTGKRHPSPSQEMKLRADTRKVMVAAGKYPLSLSGKSSVGHEEDSFACHFSLYLLYSVC